MLPFATIPPSLAGVLDIFGACFTKPTFDTFTGLVTGLIGQTRRRTVCGMLLGAGLEHSWHHSRAHRFFAKARWSADGVGLALAVLIVDLLVPPGTAITLAIDDTLFKRSGKKVFGALWQHDGAAKGPKAVGFGTCFVVAGIVVDLPFLTRPVCLPVLARLWRPKHTGKLAHARQMAEKIAARFPSRTVHVVGDAAYVGEHLRGLDGRITWTSRLKVTSVLHHLAPPRTGRSGRPKTKGERIGTASDLAKIVVWRTAQVRRYGRIDTIEIAEAICLWYGSFHTRTIRVIGVRDAYKTRQRSKTGHDRGYGLALVTTDLVSAPHHIVTRYAGRWSIEVTFGDARQILGVGQARNRVRPAVERTVPFGLFCYSITVLWYATAGHHPADAKEHRARARWYTTKAEPSFDDMIVKLRRVIIAHRFRHPGTDLPEPEDIRAVQLAWATAGT